MNYKTKSIITIAVLVGFMATVAIFINNLDLNITGAVVRPVCKCIEDIDCDDNNPCTEDTCLYKENCEAAVCVNTKTDGCE